MNYSDKLKKIRKTINLIRASNRDTNVLKVTPDKSNKNYPHELAKFKVYYEFLSKGYIIFTEARFEKGRCDLLIINPETAQALIVEILYSEKLEDAKKKVEKYPIETVFIDADDIKMEDVYI